MVPMDYILQKLKFLENGQYHQQQQLTNQGNFLQYLGFHQILAHHHLEMHSALKLEKSAISKVQKSIICIFKNGKKSIFAPEKSLKLPKIKFLDWKKEHDFWY